jgi:predicted lipid-binding transport protein (Tim44 family)
MKKFVITLFAAFIGIGLFVQDADAARLGGGRSFGMNRSSTPMKQAAQAPSQSAAPAVPGKPAAAPQAPTPQPSGMSRWLGPIAGLAAGIGLAALLSHFGLGEGMANMLMILLLVMAAVFLFRRFFAKSQPQPAYAGNSAGNPAASSVSTRFESLAAVAGSSTPASTTAVPAGFDTEGFLRQAKLNFIRLQAANDSGNLDDLKQFTAPEVFAEIQMQYEERGHAKQETDVQHLDAELLELVTEDERHIASVRFAGQIREGAAAAQAFAEIWHLSKPESGGSGWLVAGIQQIQ